MNDETKELWNWILDMAVASYLNRDPNTQVRKMAKKYKKITKSKFTKRTLGVIIKNPKPAMLVIMAHDDLSLRYSHPTIPSV